MRTQHRSALGNRRGLAMVSALFGLVVVSLLAAGVYNIVTIQSRSVRNRESSARALMLAEAAAAHTMALLKDSLKSRSNTALLRGSDNSASANADDGYLVGYGLSTAVQIPIAGRVTAQGRYTVRIRDDDDGDGDPRRDSNARMFARCTAATPDSGYASIDVVISGTAIPPAFASSGNLTFSGTPTITGACGNVHANGNLAFGSNTVIAGEATAGGTVSGSSYLRDTLGAANPGTGGQGPVDIPNLTYAQFCPANAHYLMRSDGVIERRIPPYGTFNATGSEVFGFKRASSSPVIWDVSGSAMTGGFICVQGNVKISGDPGTSASPLAVTIVATGSMEISGNPYLTPATSDSILFVLGGDMSVSGNPGMNENFEGLMYARSQCKISGNPVMAGNIMCGNFANASGTVDYASLNEVSGNPTIRYSCGGYLGQGRRQLQWVQRAN